jgi:fatty acid synthase subunit alpha
VKHSKIKDEPIKDLLGNINSSLISLLLDRQYGGDKSKIPTIDYLSLETASPVDLSTTPDVRCGKTATGITYTLGKAIPDTSTWLEALAGPQLGWLRALLTLKTIVQGTSYVDNPIRRLLAPRPEQRVVIETSGSTTSVAVYSSAHSHGDLKPAFKAVEIIYESASKMINVMVYEHRRDISVPLYLQFEFKPSMGSAPIHEIAEGRNLRIKQFYWKLWYGDDSELPGIDIREVFTGPEIIIDATSVEKFCAVVGNQDTSFKSIRNIEVKAPMDFAIVTGRQVRFFVCVL